MTRILKSGNALIEREESASCEFCGKVAELRPYGPKGERICFACGMLNLEVTRRRASEFFGKGGN